LGKDFFMLLTLRFVKMVFLRTATHRVIGEQILSTCSRLFKIKRAKENNEESGIRTLEVTVALFYENEISSFAALLAGFIVVIAVLLEMLRLAAFKVDASVPFSCDHAFFFLDAETPSDIPLLIGNVTLVSCGLRLACVCGCVRETWVFWCELRVLVPESTTCRSEFRLVCCEFV
jgi:hypothetical protein